MRALITLYSPNMERISEERYVEANDVVDAILKSKFKRERGQMLVSGSCDGSFTKACIPNACEMAARDDGCRQLIVPFE